MDLSSAPFRVDFPWGIISPLGPVEPEAVDRHRRWLAEGHHGTMTYLEKYPDQRADPRMLLEGAQSMVCVAFPYFTEEKMQLPISLYARGRDYHEVVREYLNELAAKLPGETRVCVDTAPLRERYWASRAGLGFIGRNNHLIIPGLGSYFFLGFILTTALLESMPRRAPSGNCGECRRCVDACPGKCISADGRGIDARTCLSYLTIEHRGPIAADSLPTLYGCDVCQRVCPYNAAARPTPVADFHPSAEFSALTRADVAALTPETFAALFRHSAIRRTKLAGLLRNLALLR